ncbi:short-chain dehydrogenase [Aliifodinibius salipaludis]|uniref:Short-chain dehydrogenase n=1 Tax=Fodinibius salipaludis TaxID=2032627 RepID=A0A2A2GG04_9BACT|nr:SDR family oxidoreductase [Aliifodinibius salipaludis]PAU95914.1 short-chain dehydrogenase [Aliifodinibius salipaludis]
MSKVAVVTGASRGIGREICKELADKGHHAVAVARSEQPLNKLANSYPNISAIPTDLTNQKDVDKLVTQLERDYDTVDILINNAGTLINKTFEELTLDDWRSQLESNLISAIHITNKMLSLFSNDAHIVNISSMGGFQGSAKFPGLAAYSVSKGALSILTECLSVELSDKNIKANALCLGAVQTEMLENAFPGMEAPVSAKGMGNYITDFAIKGSAFYNGKILPVSLEDPD